YYYCGTASGYCGAGCQAAFGSCTGASSSASAVSPPPPASTSATPSPSSSPVSNTISDDGTCGGAGGKTCAGSAFGNCCSTNGWCGSTDGYCGTGCNPAFGTCTSSAPVSSSVPQSTATTSAATPSSTAKISPDGSCGGANGYTCPGTQCCGKRGYCGSPSFAYCGMGCQPAFGTCAPCPVGGCTNAINGGNPTCPQDGGSCFIRDGKRFKVDCNGGTSQGNAVLLSNGTVATSSANSLAACIDDCANTPGCETASFFTSMGKQTCGLYSNIAAYSDSSFRTGYFANLIPQTC
ncbi:agglutinin isolectin 1, partial [Pyricularia oryzae Y34]